MTVPRNSQYTNVVLVNPTDGSFYAAGGGGTPSTAATIANGADVTQGAIADAAVTNPASSASVIALLKGLITLQTTANALLTTIATNTGRIP